MTDTPARPEGIPARWCVIRNPAFAEYVRRQNSAGVFGSPSQLGPQFDIEQEAGQ